MGRTRLLGTKCLGCTRLDILDRQLLVVQLCLVCFLELEACCIVEDTAEYMKNEYRCAILNE
jgi:hypothetical protein